MRLTKQLLDKTTALKGDTFLWDEAPKGFGVRIRPTGVKTFVFAYRVSGGRAARRLRYTIGRFGDLTVEQARTEALKLAGRVASGADPSADRAAARRAAERQENTVKVVADDFIERYAKPRLRSWREYERILNYYVKPSEVGRSPIDRVSRRQVITLLDHVADRNGEVMSDHVLAVLRKLFNWYATRDDDFQSPIVKGMAKTSSRERARDRVLSDDEIRAVWGALDRQNYPFAPLIKLMFMTAARRQEVAEACWEEIGTDTWTIPKQRYKTKLPLAVPLTAGALALIRGVPRQGRYLFTTTGETPFSGFSKAKRRLDRESGVQDWTLHDIRRTARTLMVRARVRPDIAERVLGHVIPGVAGVYDRYDYLAEKRHALCSLECELQAVLRAKPKPRLVLVVNR